MNGVNQNSVLKSQQSSLIPSPRLIDGRTEKDMLGFMANFTSLINFYDRNNNKFGDWTPFLLKDPIFLLALIASTNFKNIHRLYISACSKLKSTLYSEEKKKCKKKFNNYSATSSVNQLFGQLTDISVSIQKWAHYMQRSDNTYELKTYLLGEIKTQYSTYLWALLAFQDQLTRVDTIKNVAPVDSNVRELFNNKLWQQGKNKGPYWKILGLDKNLPKDGAFQLSKLSACQIFDGIKVVGDQLFPFLKKTIDYALVEFDSQKVRKSKYPDTILLRVFINLLKIQQDQLNTISQKHLEFYYNDILKQTQKLASPDNVFACAELAKEDEVYKLPKNTQFDAGTDENTEAIVFENTSEVTLNPGKITSTYTLFKVENTEKGTDSIYLREIQAPTEVQSDENGEIQTWNTFGNTIPKDSDTKVALGFAFASPILFLREGKRTINLTFSFDSYVDLDLFCKAEIYLSTKETWLKIEDSFTSYVYTKTMMYNETNASQIKLTIALDAAMPAIESFEENPDGLSSEWPLFKIEFSDFKNLEQPPILTSLAIDVEVKKLRAFQLNNDFGALSTEAPFQLFGSTPSLNSNFIIGNSEVFSKPLSYLEIELNWDNLPSDFRNYYSAYNQYLCKLHKDCKSVQGPSLFVKLSNVIMNLFKPSGVQPAYVIDYTKDYYFKNTSFQVGFKWLNDKVWTQFSMPKFGCKTESETNNPDSNTDASANNQDIEPEVLFCVDGDELVPNSKSKFRYKYNSSSSRNITPYPQLQKTELEYTEASAFGFMKVQLMKPNLGFGNDIYAQVVSDVALKNAKNIVDESPEDLILAPNPPFVPEVTLFTANYSAAYTYKFDRQKNNSYPYQCFYYTPFKKFLVCDQSMPIPEYTYQLASTIVTKDAPKVNGLALYPAYKKDGALILGLENLVTPQELNMYFELVRNYTASDTSEDIEVSYAFMEEKGWGNLPLLSDSTKNFGCSGIIQVNVPDSISMATYYMPEDKYWLSISVSGDLDMCSQTAYLNTNGIELKRSGSNYLEQTNIPKLEDNAITGPINPIPEIFTIVQPFPSFGGKAAETESVANERISARLKTKDRVVSASDFFTAIKESFNAIYYSKTLYTRATNTINVYLVKKVNDYKSPRAFMPLVDRCTEAAVKQFLEERTSGLSHIKVSNYDMEYVTVITTISIKPGFEFDNVMKNINQDLMIYLSPWISTTKEQVQIDQGISTAEVANLIRAVDGVANVDNIQFETIVNGEKVKQAKRFITPIDAKTLFVSSAKHSIKDASKVKKLVYNA